ncbi:7988_t:CDS:2, partial [Paraglomus occultum]
RVTPVLLILASSLSSANKENAISAKKDIVEEILSALEEWTKALGLPKADDRIASLPATGVSGKDPVEECVQLLEDIKITIEKPLIFTKRRPSESVDPEDYSHKPVVSKKEWTHNVTLVLNSDETSDSPAISSAIVKVPCKSSQEISCKTPQETPCKPLQETPCKPLQEIPCTIPQETPCKIPRETPCKIPQTRLDLNGDITLSYQTPQRRLLNEHTVTRVEDISNLGTNRRWTRLNDKTLEQMASLTYAFRTRAQKTKD